MVTTKRATNETYASVFSSSNNSNVQLLERPVTKSYNTDSLPVTETLEETKARMQRNLDRLLNYDRYAEEAKTEEATKESTEVAEQKTVENHVDEDIRPSSTTMQFGDADLDEMYKEMNKAENSASTSYKLNLRGKIVVAVYAFVVALIFALIVVNTGVLTVLTNTNTVKTDKLNQKQSEYSALMNEIDSISSNEYVINVAENDFGMVKGN